MRDDGWSEWAVTYRLRSGQSETVPVWAKTAEDAESMVRRALAKEKKEVISITVRKGRGPGLT